MGMGPPTTPPVTGPSATERVVRDGAAPAPASDGAEQLADEVTEAVAALSPAEGVANGHPDTPSPTANPRQTARPSAKKAGVCPVKKEGVGARAGTTSRQKAQTANPCCHRHCAIGTAPASATRR